MSYLWASQKLLDITEYKFDELQKLHRGELIIMNDEEDKFISHRLATRHGVSSVTLKTKTGKEMSVNSEYQIFEFDKGIYMAIKGSMPDNQPRSK